MKKFIYSIAALLTITLAMTSCSDDPGTEAGSDNNPVVTIFTYEPGGNYNSDNDVKVRFATNSKVGSVYYLVEKADEKKTFIEQKGEAAYAEHVVADGKKIENLGAASSADMVVTDLMGTFAITAVAVNGNAKKQAEVTFTGLAWETVTKGIYQFSENAGQKVTGVKSVETELQVCTTDSKLYRFVDVFGPGHSMKINMLNIKGADDDGEYTFFRVKPTKTGLTFGSYGDVWVRDIGYWQNNDAFVTEGGYESGMYGDGSCFIYIQWYVSAGNLGYDYDVFVPAK